MINRLGAHHLRIVDVGSLTRNSPSHLAFGKNGTARKKLEQLYRQLSIKQCGYCNEIFTPNNLPTFDHIKPDSAGGTSHVNNGVLVSQTCNMARGNTPFIEFLEGKDGQFRYLPKSHMVQRLSWDPQPPLIAKNRTSAFSNTLKTLIAQQPSNAKNTWFNQALNNLLFPVQGIGKQEQIPHEQDIVKRMARLLKNLASVDSNYWLTPRFIDDLNKHFPKQPHIQNWFEQAQNNLKQPIVSSNTHIKPLLKVSA